MRQTKLCAHNKYMRCTDKEGETILSSHKKGTAPGKNEQTSVRSHRNGTVPENTKSSHKKGTAPKPNRLLCHLTRKGPLLKNRLLCHHKRGTASQTVKDSNKNVATDHKMRVDLWNLVTTCGMALRLEILIAGGSVSHQAWSSSALKGYSNIFLIALETRPILYSG